MNVVLGFKGQGYRVSKCILHTNDYVTAHLIDDSNTAWVQILECLVLNSFKVK